MVTTKRSFVLRNVHSSPQAAGRGREVCLSHRRWHRLARSGGLFDPRRADGRQTHHHLRGEQYRRRLPGRYQAPKGGLPLPRRARDGGPLRVPVGSDLMRSIPSLDVKDASVLEDFYRINKDHPNYSLCRTTHKRGQPFPTDGKMLLTPKAQGELMKLFYTHRRELFDRRFEEFVSDEFFASNFWVYWLSMFAIGPWHGALEMKLYMNRFVQHLGGMADLSTIKFTRLNQFDSLVLPLVKWLEQQGVTIVYDTKVTNVVFDISPERKVARRIEWIQGGKRGGRDVTKNDLVLITNSSAVENTSWGGPPHPGQVD